MKYEEYNKKFDRNSLVMVNRQEMQLLLILLQSFFQKKRTETVYSKHLYY